MPFLEDLNRAWTDWPPLRKFAAVQLGHKAPTRRSNNLQELLAMFPGGAMKAGK